MTKLKGKCCPGEAKCTSDRKDGEIAGVRGRAQGYTLQNHCHNEEVTPFNGLKEKCPFFDTKPDNVPQNLMGAIQAAEEMREHKMLGLLPDFEKVTAFEYECYRIAEHASNAIEAEAIQEAQANSGTQGSPSVEKIGDSSPIDSAFSNWEK